MLVSLGVSFRKAPLATLDALSLRNIPSFYKLLRATHEVDGAMILQTCNRVELFLDAKDPLLIRYDILREWALETKFKLAELNKLVEAREGRSVVEFGLRQALSRCLLGRTRSSAS